jgi:hypothetical protein
MSTFLELNIDGEEQGYGNRPGADEYEIWLVYQPNPAIVIPLGGHQVPEVSPEEGDTSIRVRGKRLNGRWYDQEIVTRMPLIKRFTGTVLHPKALYTHMERVGEAMQDCWMMVHVAICASGDEAHWYAHPDTIFGESRDTGALVGFGENGEIFDTETPFSVTARRKVAALLDLPPGEITAAYGVIEAVNGCPGGCGSSNRALYIGGGTGAAVYLAKSTDGGQTWSALTISGATATQYLVPVYADANIIIVREVDDAADPLSATAGTLWYSRDETTWQKCQDSGGDISAAFNFVIKADGRFVAGEGANIHTSNDGVYWTQLTQSVTAGILVGAAYDPIKRRTYIVGDNTGGTAYVLVGSTVTSITSQLLAADGAPVAAAALYAVFSGAGDHIVIGGANGELYESFAASGGSWEFTDFSATAGDIIRGFGGNKFDLWLQMADEIHYRSPLSRMDWKAYTLTATPGGAFYGFVTFKDAHGFTKGLRAVNAGGEFYRLDPAWGQLEDRIDAALA